MQPSFVTFTGVDSETQLNVLERLLESYPTEFAILLGNKQGAAVKYPSQDFVEYFGKRFQGTAIACHLCGKYARMFQDGDDMPFLDMFQRVQVNMTANQYDYEKLIERSLNRPFDVIVQTRDPNGFPDVAPLYPLYDCSGGRGKVSSDIPSHLHPNLVGYAGGLGPSNVLSEISRIKAYNFWIDMETKVRDHGNLFDLDACEDVLQQIYST